MKSWKIQMPRLHCPVCGAQLVESMSGRVHIRAIGRVVRQRTIAPEPEPEPEPRAEDDSDG